MNAIERCRAKLDALNEVNKKIAEHSVRMSQAITTEIVAINFEITESSKSVASILKGYRKKLERARKILADDEVDA